MRGVDNGGKANRGKNHQATCKRQFIGEGSAPGHAAERPRAVATRKRRCINFASGTSHDCYYGPQVRWKNVAQSWKTFSQRGLVQVRDVQAFEYVFDFVSPRIRILAAPKACPKW